MPLWGGHTSRVTHEDTPGTFGDCLGSAGSSGSQREALRMFFCLIFFARGPEDSAVDPAELLPGPQGRTVSSCDLSPPWCHQHPEIVPSRRVSSS